MVQSIGQLLKARREELGLSRRELAERAGTSHSAIARVEVGRYRTTVETLQRMMDALKIRLILRLEKK